MGTNNKIVLVFPISDTHYVVPPVGLGYLATALRKNGFSDIVILDCLKENLTFSSLKERLEQLNPKVVGFQIFSYDFESVVRSISITKSINKNIITIVGGPHVSATNISSLEEIKEADYGFSGEAEVGLPKLLDKILKGKDIPFGDIPGLIWREDNIIRKNPGDFIADLDDLGFPAWDLMPPASYPDNPQGGFYRQFPIAPISTTRGCPYLCTFCGSGVNMGRKLRPRSIMNVLAEMDMLYNDYGVREFHIIDDMFNFSAKRVEEFCQGITQKGWNINYTFPNGLRLNQLTREMLEMMKKTGAYAFTVGVESGSQRVLDSMKKGLTLELIEEKVNLICSVGLEPSGFFIIGFPDETKEDIEATIKFAKKLKIKRAHFSNFLPLPGTESTKKLIDSKEIENVKWGDLFYSKVPYSPKGITKKELKQFQRRAFLEFYLRPHILWKMILEIKSFRHLGTIAKRMKAYLFDR